MRYGEIASPSAWLAKICVALAKLRRVGMTMYNVISLTIDQLQFKSNPESRKVNFLIQRYIYIYIYRGGEAPMPI